jgi:hypothetical protein
MKQSKSLIIVTILFVIGFFITQPLCAVEIEVQGEGNTVITKDVSSVQYNAKKEATESAMTMAINRILGANAMKNPKVQEKFGEIISQINVYKVKQNNSARTEGNRYIVNTVLIIDETKLRQLISDMGIAFRTNVVRSSAILTIMDEFFTTPSDLQNPAPLSDVTVYSYDRDTNYKEKEALSEKSMDSKAVSKRGQEASSVDARGQSSGSLKARNEDSGSVSAKNKESGSVSGKSSFAASSPEASASASDRVNAGYSQKGSVDGKYSQKGSVDAKYDEKGSVDARYAKGSSLDTKSLSKNSLDYGRFVSASDNEHEFFTNIKEYQPKNGIPDRQNFTIKALQSSYQTYDIKILDNDRLRSKYFQNNPISVDKLENSAELDKYVKFSRDEAKADFFSIGSSIIVDRGKNPNTDSFVCDGMVAIKVYSTLDSETIASGALTESASGNSPDQCRTNVAKKIGEGLGNVISNKVQEFWKKREMYGMEYVVILTGDVPPMTRIQFTNTIKKVQGVSNVKQRAVESGKYEFVISYNGSDPLADAIFTQIASSPLSATFNNYDYAVDGNQIKFYQIGTKK